MIPSTANSTVIMVVIEFLEPVDIRGLKPKERKEVLDAIPGKIQAARLKNLPMTEK